MDYDKKLFYVRDDANILAKPFNVSEVKSYLTAEFLSYSFVAELDMSLKIFRSLTSDIVLTTEVLDPHDDSAKGNDIDEAKRNEVKVLP